MKPVQTAYVFGLTLALSLAACSKEREPQEDTATASDAPIPVEPDGGIGDGAGPPEPEPTEAPTENQQALLDSLQCSVVAGAYADAIAVRDFTFAARFWADTAVDAARLSGIFAGYAEPLIRVSDQSQDGAAGSLYCTVSGMLTDVSKPATPPREGELILRRVNDVDGATPDQLRWRVTSSSFVEPIQRGGRNDPG